MNPMVYLLVFLLSGVPESDQHLEAFQSILQATRDFSKNIRGSMDNFHAFMVEMGEKYPGGSR